MARLRERSSGSRLRAGRLGWDGGRSSNPGCQAPWTCCGRGQVWDRRDPGHGFRGRTCADHGPNTHSQSAHGEHQRTGQRCFPARVGRRSRHPGAGGLQIRVDTPSRIVGGEKSLPAGSGTRSVTVSRASFSSSWFDQSPTGQRRTATGRGHHNAPPRGGNGRQHSRRRRLRLPLSTPSVSGRATSERSSRSGPVPRCYRRNPGRYGARPGRTGGRGALAAPGRAVLRGFRLPRFTAYRRTLPSQLVETKG